MTEVAASSQVRLGDVAYLTMGNSPSAKYVNPNGIGLPLLNGPTEFEDPHPLPAQWTTSGTRFAEPGDILFCVRGSTTGRMNLADQRYAIGRGIASIRAKNPDDAFFLRQSVEAALDDLLALSTGTVFPNVSRADLENQFIPWLEDEFRRPVAHGLQILEDTRLRSRSLAQLAQAAASAVVTSSPAFCSVGDISQLRRKSFDPRSHEVALVDHYSLPAFDNGEKAQRILAGSIGSSKLSVESQSLLVSRLNPGTNRTWLVYPSEAVEYSVCSTEYAVLQPKGVPLCELWAAVAGADISDTLATIASGTSSSHQRVRPEDVLAASVPDPRELHADDRKRLSGLAVTYRLMSRLATYYLQTRNTVAARLLAQELVADPIQAGDAA